MRHHGGWGGEGGDSDMLNFWNSYFTLELEMNTCNIMKIFVSIIDLGIYLDKVLPSVLRDCSNSLWWKSGCVGGVENVSNQIQNAHKFSIV